MGIDIKTWSTPISREELRHRPCVGCGGERFVQTLSCGGFSFVRCRSCGLTQQNPQPAEEAVASRYGERHGQDYLNYELANEAAFLRLQELALQDIAFEDLAPGRILDAGCATGALLEKLRDRGWETLGVELCGPSAEYARTRRGLDVRTTTLEGAAFPSRYFDVVHASHLIEHLNDPRSFIKEARRVLKETGILLISTPNIDGFQARLFGKNWRSAIFDHLYLFSRGTLTDILRREGFSVVAVATWGGLASGAAPKPIKHIADRLAKRFGFGDVMMVRAVQSP